MNTNNMELKPTDNYLSFLLLVLGFFILSSHTTAMAQSYQPYAATASKKDGRFSANIKDVGVSDPAGLMDKFDMGVQWWTLLGEAIEYYQVRWYSSGKYKIGDRWIYRKKLEKYPDLLKRFDNLRPSKLSIKIIGAASGGVINTKRGYSPAYADYYRKGSPYKKDGQSYDRYYLDADFYYVVEDRKLLLTKSGKIGDGIVPGSPHWNEFIYWSSQDPYRTLGIEKRKKEDKSLEDRNKHLFKNTNQISLNAQKVQLEWPEYELRGIAEKFDKYESGEEEPSPLEIVEKKKQEEVDKLGQYLKDDFWSEPEVNSTELEVFRGENNFTNAYRKEVPVYGVRYKESKIILIEPEYVNIIIIPFKKYILTKDPYTEGDHNPYKLFNDRGKVLFEKFFEITLYYPGHKKYDDAKHIQDDQLHSERKLAEWYSTKGGIRIFRNTFRDGESYGEITCYDFDLRIEPEIRETYSFIYRCR